MQKVALVNSTTDTLNDGFYNVWPGNGVGLLFQLRNPHGAKTN